MTIKEFVSKVNSDIESTIKEVSEECNCYSLYKNDFLTTFSFKNFIHIPFLPPLQHPGWLLEYVLGPFDEKWLENLFSDFQAGITVLLTLVPQVNLLSYLSYLILYYTIFISDFIIFIRVYHKQLLLICHLFMVYILH